MEGKDDRNKSNDDDRKGCLGNGRLRSPVKDLFLLTHEPPTVPAVLVTVKCWKSRRTLKSLGARK